MRIWAHRGCSQMYPENTLLSFKKASEIKGLTGIELDIQLTKDGQMVVIHDEQVDRTTNGSGYVKDYTLAELKKLKMASVNGSFEQIPTIEEVFDLLDDKIKGGLLINIELKNSIVDYEGMEHKIIQMVHDRNYTKNIVYSSFLARSVELVKSIDSNAMTGILDTRASDCLYKLKGGCGADAIHPFWKCIDLSAEQLAGYTVRAFGGGRLFPEKPSGIVLDLKPLEMQGITDIFLNEPEKYL